MKKIFLSMLGVLLLWSEAHAQNHRYIIARGLPDSIMTPGFVYSIERGKRWKKPTHGIVETKDKEILAMGPVTYLGTFQDNGIYRIGDSYPPFALPLAEYGMKGKTLLRGEHRLEAITIEPEPCLCERGIGLIMGEDSVISNVSIPQKMVLDVHVDSTEYWTPTPLNLPQIFAASVDTVDGFSTTGYVLVIKYSDEITCDMFELMRRELRTDFTTTMVYQPDGEHAKYFSEVMTPSDKDKRKVVGFLVLKDHEIPKGVKKVKHAKRDRISKQDRKQKRQERKAERKAERQRKAEKNEVKEF